MQSTVAPAEEDPAFINGLYSGIDIQVRIVYGGNFHGGIVDLIYFAFGLLHAAGIYSVKNAVFVFI